MAVNLRAVVKGLSNMQRVLRSIPAFATDIQQNDGQILNVRLTAESTPATSCVWNTPQAMHSVQYRIISTGRESIPVARCNSKRIQLGLHVQVCLTPFTLIPKQLNDRIADSFRVSSSQCLTLYAGISVLQSFHCNIQAHLITKRSTKSTERWTFPQQRNVTISCIYCLK